MVSDTFPLLYYETRQVLTVFGLTIIVTTLFILSTFHYIVVFQSPSFLLKTVNYLSRIEIRRFRGFCPETSFVTLKGI